MRVEQFDDSVCAAGETVVAAVVKTHRQHRSLVNGHFSNTRIRNVHIQRLQMPQLPTTSMCSFDVRKQAATAAAAACA